MTQPLQLHCSSLSLAKRQALHVCEKHEVLGRNALENIYSTILTGILQHIRKEKLQVFPCLLS